MRYIILLLLTPFLQAINPYFSVSVCSSGCTYPNTAVGLFNAIHFMATQQDTVSCIPGIIFITGTVQVNTGLDFPAKNCAQYIELNGGTYHTSRFTIGTDDLSAAKIVVSTSGETFNVNSGTHYWRVRNLNIVTAALDTGIQATYTVTNASWSAGVVTYTIGTHASGGTYSIVGASNNAYNSGNTSQVLSETSTTISLPLANNPGTWAGTATANLLFNYYIGAFIAWGNGFDQSIYPDHLEVIHCGMRSASWGEGYSALFLFGNHFIIKDNYFSGFAKQGDSQAIQTFASDIVLVNNYISAVTETMGTGGSALGVGFVPYHHVIKGNYFNKDAYIAFNRGSGAPTKPCFINTPYHDIVANQDYLCTVTTPVGTTTGTWVLQPNLLNYAVGIYPYQWSANHIEYKTGQDVQMIGNFFGAIFGQSKQTSVGLVLNVVSQPFTGSWTTGLPYPVTDIPQSWTTVSNFNIAFNHFDEGFSPLNLGYAVYTPCSTAKFSYGTTTWTITGNGTTTASGTGLPVGFVSGGNAGNMIVDGLTYPVASPVPLGGASITFTLTLSPGTHTMVLPCDDSHHHFTVTNNLATNMADERNYCASFNGSPCVHASDCGNSCGTTGFSFIDSGDHDTIFDHNTALTSQFSSKSGATQYQGYNLNNLQDFSGIIALRNSIEPIGVNGWLSIPVNDGCGFANLTSHFGGSSYQTKNILTSDPPSFQTWQSFATGSISPGCSTPNIFPTDHAGGFSWSSIVSPTTYKVTNPTYQGWATDGRDPGADIDRVNLYSGNAQSGAANPVLDTSIRSISLTSSTSIVIYATAYSTADCTWELSTGPNAYTSPIAAASVVQTGRDIVATWTGLATNTLYYARMTCPCTPALKVENFDDGSRVMIITGH